MADRPTSDIERNKLRKLLLSDAPFQGYLDFSRTVTWAIGLVTWPTIARLVRAEFRVLREKEFVMAARGPGHTRIVFREILPNALPAIIVTASVMVASAILMEAALSFLGLGDPNVVSWAA